jgi:2-polyprenyl-3-methyl-5-hydroxy-6-metoxy-1,4-benzoquinol methylase
MSKRAMIAADHPGSQLAAKPDPSYFSHVRKEILPLMTPAKRCLEIGCGRGRTLEWLKAQGLIEWTGGIELQRDLDMSPLDYFQTGDVEQISFPSHLDAVLCLDILEHLKDPGAVLARLRSSLNDKGYIVASVPNVANYRVVLPLLFGKWTYRESGLLDRTHLRFFTRASAIAMFKEAGFEVEIVHSSAFGIDVPMRALTFGMVPMFHFQYIIRARKA